MSAPSPALAELRKLEIPDCDCGGVVIPACQRAGKPCAKFCLPNDRPDERTGEISLGPQCHCDCVLARGDPCEHVYRAEDPFWDLFWADALMEDGTDESMQLVILEWGAKLGTASTVKMDDGEEDEYFGEPQILSLPHYWTDLPEFARPLVAQKDDGRIDSLCLRFHFDYHLWRDGDKGRGGLELVYVASKRLANGEDEQMGLKLHNPLEARPDQPRRKKRSGPKANAPWTHPVWDEQMRQTLHRHNAILAEIERRRKSA